MQRSQAVSILILFGLALSAGTSVTVGAENHSIHATDRIDTPTQTITIGSSEYAISSLGYVDDGNELQYTVSTDSSSSYRVDLYDSDNQIVTSQRHTGDGTYSFSTESLSPGTYVLALRVDDSIVDIHPVVVSGYEFSVDAPASVAEDEHISITVKLTGSADEPRRVAVTALNDSWSADYTASKVDNRTYNVLISGLSSDTYRFYATTRSSEEFGGEDEITGLSSVHTLAVGSAQNESSADSSTKDDGTTDQPDSSGESTAAPSSGTTGGTASETATATAAPSEQPTVTNTPNTSSTSTLTVTAVTTPDGTTVTTTATSNGSNPAEVTSAPTTHSGTSPSAQTPVEAPGFVLAHFAIALLVVGALLSRTE